MNKSITLEEYVGTDEIQVQVTKHATGAMFVTLTSDGTCSFPVQDVGLLDDIKNLILSMSNDLRKETE